MRIINRAHGAFAILGVFVVSLIAAHTGISPFYALAAAIPLRPLCFRVRGFALSRHGRQSDDERRGACWSAQSFRQSALVALS
jgi:hypothetical protein